MVYENKLLQQKLDSTESVENKNFWQEEKDALEKRIIDLKKINSKALTSCKEELQRWQEQHTKKEKEVAEMHTKHQLLSEQLEKEKAKTLKVPAIFSLYSGIG